MADDVMTSELAAPVRPDTPLGARLWTLFHESWKYFLVSLVSLGLDLGVYWALINLLGVHYLAANVVSVSAGLVINYLLSVTLVFRERRLANRHAEFIGFVVIGLIGLAVNEVFVGLFVGGLHMTAVLGKCAAAGASFLFNFGARKALLFSGRK
jgi:putative flippase GtrA